ncbi:MAG: aldo/keto reductase [Actinomycetota bacterium]
MQHRRLGSLTASVVGLHASALGTRLDRGDSDRLVGTALDVGLTLFVTGEVEADGVAEEHLGRAIGRTRDDVVVATTVGDASPPRGIARLSREHVRLSVDASLTRLGRDWIDLLVLRDLDPRTSIEETLGALDEQVRAGKIRELAIGEVPADRLAEVMQAADELALRAPVAVVTPYGPHRLGADDELAPAAVELGLGVVAIDALADGRLVDADPDHDADGNPDELVERLRGRLDDLARHHGRDVVDLALAWTVERAGITAAITVASRPDEVVRLGTVGALPLDDVLRAELDERILDLDR